MEQEKRTKQELLSRLTEAKARIAEINEQYQGQYIDPESSDGREWNSLNAEVDQLSKTVKQVEARDHRIAELATNPSNTDEGFSFLTSAPGAVRGQDIYDLSTIRASLADPQAAKLELQERAHRAIDTATFPHEKADQARCKEQVTRILATVDDEQNSIARRILATGNPVYKEAFGMALANPGGLSPKFQAALGVGSAPDGGYAVPYELDPTIIPTSDYQVNPFRQISRVVQITGKEYDLVTSSGVTANRRIEGAESTDNAPTLAQPTIRPTRVDVFIPFSIELQQDWGSLQTEMARLIQDAKDVEEATVFATGAGGTLTPQGIVTGATVTVSTAATATLAVADTDSVETALGARFQSRAQWCASRAIYSKIRQLTSSYYDPFSPIQQGLNRDGTTGNMGRSLHGYPANEVSTMSVSTASSQLVMVLGDFSYYLIVDRLGMTLDLVPHLFGSNRMPIGKRGFYAVWRNNGMVIDAKAFRVLKMA